MNELPVVHRSEGILIGFRSSSDDFSQVDGEGSDVIEGVLVGEGGGELVEFGGGVFHEVERGEGMGGGEAEGWEEGGVDVLHAAAFSYV